MNTVPSNPFRRITHRSFFRQFSLGLCWLAAALPLVAGETTNSTAVRTAAVGSQSYADFGRGYIPTPHMRQARPAGPELAASQPCRRSSTSGLRTV